MELLFDTASLSTVAKYQKYYPISGVTTNPSILKAEGAIDFFLQMQQLKQIIGADKSLHVQVTSFKSEDMLREAESIISQVGADTYIKIPVTEEGLAAISQLKAKGILVTATAIYNQMQAYAAMMHGADYLAVYCNRIESTGGNFTETIRDIRRAIDGDRYKAKILAASFKNISQVNRAYAAGAHAATVTPDLLHASFTSALLRGAEEDFSHDWSAIHGYRAIYEL